MKVILIAVCLLLLCGCTGTGRLYDLETGEVSTFSYSYNGRGHGAISSTLKGQNFTGEYSVINNADVSWGSIYANAFSPAGSTSGTATGTAVSMRGQRRGSAILTSNGTVIDCEMLVGSNGHGSGGCRDNHGKKYRMMF
jgi:hypothetical protein